MMTPHVLNKLAPRAMQALRSPTRLQVATILFVLLTLLAMWASVFALLNSYRTGAVEAQIQQDANVARALQEQTVRVIAAVDQALLRLADAAAGSGVVQESDYQRMVDATGLSQDILPQLSLIDSKGLFVGSNLDPTGSKTGHVDLSAREHVRVHLQSTPDLDEVRKKLTAQGLFIGKPVLGKVSNKWTIQLSRPVPGATGSTIGVVVASLDISYFEEVYRHVALGTAGGVSLVGADGVVRASILGGHAIAAGQSKDKPVPLSGLADEGTLLGSSMLTNDKQLGAYQQVRGYPLYVVTTSSIEEALTQWRKAQHLIVVLAACLSVVMVAAGILFLASIRRLERQHQALQISSERARAADRAKTEFLAAISHELRTPLTSIRGFAELMERRGEDARFREQATLIRKASEQLNGLLTQILDLVELESGAMALATDPIAIRGVVQSCADMFRVTAVQKSLGLFVHFSSSLPVTLLGDAFRLQQIMNNLLSNAIKFTEAGQIDVHVELDGSSWLFRVDDTGCGIEESMQEAIFEKFRQGNANVSYQHGGTGLGLALSRLLARRMGGDISVTSQPGQGTSFTLKLPLLVGTANTGKLIDVAASYEAPRAARMPLSQV